MRERTGRALTVINARFAKPLDTELVRRLVQNHEVLITIEEGAVGRLRRSCCSTWRARSLDGVEIRQMVLPDVFIDHDKPEKMYELAGLNAPGIVATVLSTLGREAGELGLAERA